MITQSELKGVLNYDPKTGVFTWKERIAHSIIVGSVAGYINSHGYRAIVIFGKQYRAHRLAWLYEYGCLPKLRINHRNNNRADNRIRNLREGEVYQINSNRLVTKNNKLGVKGVAKVGEKYKVRACFKRKLYYLGTFDTLEEAKQARRDFVKPKHGEFYREE